MQTPASQGRAPPGPERCRNGANLYSSSKGVRIGGTMSQSDDPRVRGRFAELFERLSAHRDEASDTDAESAVPFRTSNPLRAEAHAASAVPWSLRVAAAWSWRAIAVAVGAAGIVWACMQLSAVVLPVAIALLLSVLLEPLVRFLVKRLHLSRTWGAAGGLLLALLLVGAMVSQAASSISSQFPSLLSKASAGLDQAVNWLVTGPLGLDTSAVDESLSSLQSEVAELVKGNGSVLASGALSVTSSLASLVAGTLIMLFCLFFFLKDGRHIWLWVVRLLPAPARVPVHESAIRGWVTTGAYVRTQIKVAAIDAVGIGAGAFFLGVPMAVPITVLVFFGSFIPIVGAFLSGAVAVFVAVVDQGLTSGLIMLAIILVVQQVEGNVLQPWLMSNAVSLHPVAVLLVVAGAGSIAGIPGALFGVPIAAFLNSTFLYLHGYDSLPALATDPGRPGGPPGMLQSLIADTYRRTDGHDAAAPAQPHGPGEGAHEVGAAPAAAGDGGPGTSPAAPGAEGAHAAGREGTEHTDPASTGPGSTGAGEQPDAGSDGSEAPA